MKRFALASALLLPILFLAGCISSSDAPPPANTTVVVPNGTTTVVCPSGYSPPC